jgi:hypothetical protein
MPYQDHACERRIDLIFQGVGKGHLDPTDFASADDKDFEHLEIAEISQVPWVQQNGTAIFCIAPIPKPLELYFVIHDFLIAQGSMRTAEHYLNSRGDSRHFRRVVQSQAYLLGNFPPPLRDVVVAELRAQGVPHTEQPTEFDRPGNLLVRFQQSWFFCASAEAEFDD